MRVHYMITCRCRYTFWKHWTEKSYFRIQKVEMAGKYHKMAFPDYSWTRGGVLFIEPISTGEERIYWNITRIPSDWWQERKKLKSDDFLLPGSTCNFFLFINRDQHYSQFGINIRTHCYSDAAFDCCGNISFITHSSGEVIKNIQCQFKSERGDSHWRVENIISDSELGKFLTNLRISCTICIKKSNIQETGSQAEMTQSDRSSASTAPTQAQLPENQNAAFPVTSFPLGGLLCMKSVSAEEKDIYWDIESFLRGCWSARVESGESLRELKSFDFPFAGAAFHFFASFDIKGSSSRFGIVRTRSPPDAVFDCFCDISFRDMKDFTITNFEFDLKCGSATSHWEKKDFLSDFELGEFLPSGKRIYCRIKIKQPSIKEACSQNEVPYASENTVTETHTQTKQFKKEDEELPMVDFDKKLCQDFNNLLLSEEGSDVTLQVRDHQFKAHQLILSARSSVFASMFRHDIKEKATGVVDVKDCGPSSFPILLEFMYCGCTGKISAENVFDLYTSADKYDVQGLKVKCLQFIMNNLSVDTFCETIQLSLQHSENDLLKLATEFFIRNFHQIILTPKWQTFLSQNPIQGNELFIKAAKNMSPTPH